MFPEENLLDSRANFSSLLAASNLMNRIAKVRSA